MPELLDGSDGSIKDEKASNALGKGDSHTYGHTRDNSIL
jgi:hypothetical protein